MCVADVLLLFDVAVTASKVLQGLGLASSGVKSGVPSKMGFSNQQKKTYGNGLYSTRQLPPGKSISNSSNSNSGRSIQQQQQQQQRQRPAAGSSGSLAGGQQQQQQQQQRSGLLGQKRPSCDSARVVASTGAAANGRAGNSSLASSGVRPGSMLLSTPVSLGRTSAAAPKLSAAAGASRSIGKQGAGTSRVSLLDKPVTLANRR
jgi:hypothetical protein